MSGWGGDMIIDRIIDNKDGMIVNDAGNRKVDLIGQERLSINKLGGIITN